MLGKFVLLFIVWIGLTNSLDIQELIVGAIVAYVIAKFFTIDDKDIDLKLFAIKYAKFIPIFLKNLIKSNIEVARIVINPKLPINPGIVKLKTSLESDYDKLFLANAITLTPGTITIELKSNNDLYVHVLDIKNEDREVLQKEIVDEMQKGLV